MFNVFVGFVLAYGVIMTGLFKIVCQWMIELDEELEALKATLTNTNKMDS